MSIFSIGLSGLKSAQVALNTTSNNITNVSTTGYNRQTTYLSESSGGSGVQVDGVERQFNQFIADQLNQASSTNSALSAYQAQIDQIDNLLADSDSGLDSLMESFFSALQGLTSDPSDTASREEVLGTAETLASQFNSVSNYLSDMQTSINGQISDDVDQINDLSGQIASLNREITLSEAQTSQTANSLRDQRDELVSELNGLVDVDLTVQDGNTYNLTLSNGLPLVSGTQSFELQAVQSSADSSRTVVGYADGSGNTIELDDSTVTGGELGGLMTFRSESLDTTQNELGQLAASLAIGFNQLHSLGQDLNGDQGADFFDIGAPVAYSNTNNSSSGAQITDTAFSDIADLVATDYTVTVASVADDGTPIFKVTRNDTSETLEGDEAPVYDSTNQTLTFGGVALEFSGNFSAGDSYEVQPLQNIASTLSVAISDVDEIAAGSLLSVDGDMDITLSSADQGAMSGNSSYTLTLDSSGYLTVDSSVATSIQVNGEDFDPSTQTLSAGDKVTLDGVTFVVGDLPGSGETATSTISLESYSSGDNSNALLLYNLQSSDLVGGIASLSDAYASMVSDVGNDANTVQDNLDTSDTLVEQLSELQSSDSGVNLDEEAANLILYQQYYQACAKIIEVGTTIFDSIIGIDS